MLAAAPETHPGVVCACGTGQENGSDVGSQHAGELSSKGLEQRVCEGVACLFERTTCIRVVFEPFRQTLHAAGFAGCEATHLAVDEVGTRARGTSATIGSHGGANSFRVLDSVALMRHAIDAAQLV